LICDAPWAQGVSWGEDDTILFAPSNVGGLSRVPAAGGTPKVVTEPSKDKGEVSFRWPQILPGGKAAVFTVVYASGEKTIALLSLETWTWRPLFKDGTRPRYAAGHLFFLRGGSLMAVPFAPPWHDSSAPPVPVLEDVWTDPDTGFAYLDVSTDGSLVYVPEPGDDLDTRLAWVDRDGNMTALPQKQLPYWMVALSPDGKRLAAAVQGREPGVWVGDLGRGAWTRLTAGRAAGIAWTPDGKRVVYSAGDGRGASNAFWIPADGSGSAEQLTFGAGQVVPDFVTPDGKTLVYEAQTAATGWDLMSLSLVGDRQPRPFLAGPSHERFASISSDARWIAYASDESGEEAVYVRRFDGSGGKWRMAPSSGWAPIWARNGRELFYREGQKMMVVSVKTEPEFTAAAPRVLFEISTAWPAFDVSSDGAHFIIIDQQQKMPPQLVVIPDWLDELKVKMQAAAN
jgi:serine/threonine-protein kinase